MGLAKLIDLIKQEQDKQIKEHPPAKNAYLPSEEEQSDIEHFESLYDAYWIQHGENRLVESDGFHPSHLGVAHGHCARRAVYLLRGVEKKQNFTARTKRIFQNGHDVHGRVQHAIPELGGCEFEAEVAVVYDDPRVRGHADGVLVLWNQRKILLEIKSCNENVFIARKKWKKAKDEHFDQANLYAFILGIDTIWFYYECKNSQEYVIFEQKMDPKAAEKQLEKWRKAQAVFDRGELPVRPYKPESKNCAYCDLKEHCWKDSEVGVKL